MKNIFLLVIVPIFALACKDNKVKFKKLESGLEYMIVEKISQDSLLKVGDLVYMKLSYETEDGKEIFNSNNSDRRYMRTVAKPSHTGGCFEDGLLILGPGDSAVFRIHGESFLRYSEMFANLPKGVQPDDYLIVKVKIEEKISKDQYAQILANKYHESEDAEIKLLEKYLNNFNITAKPTESGLYYVEKIKGSGKKAKENSLVTVHYSLMLADGELVETTLAQEPFTFKLGNKNVIAGWEEGIAMMNEGGKASLIIPSKIAYGKEGKGKILPYTTLIFEVELLKVE